MINKNEIKNYIKVLSNNPKLDEVENIHNDLADISICGISSYYLDRIWDDCWCNLSGKYSTAEIIKHDIKFAKKVLAILRVKVITNDLIYNYD